MQRHILLFGGTAQGRLLSQALSGHRILHYYSTKTAVTFQPAEGSEAIHGALSADDIAQFAAQNDIRCIVDASHPFAENLHAELSDASTRCGIPLHRLERDFGQRTMHPLVKYCDTYTDLIQAVKSQKATVVLSATGVNTIEKLRELWYKSDRRVLFRVLDNPNSRELALQHGLPANDILCMPAPQSAEHERTLICQIGAEAVITKESGPDGGLDFKISASIASGIPIFIISKPALPSNYQVWHTIDALIQAICG